ncbi:MAG: acyltransferase [Candidatus Electrothrix sp. MAN1_4]|nr:acyltransferase [Candidatus Electrothrix sp. MAN1_4]
MLNHITILRSVAVLLVLIFHFNSNILKSGYIGVDIFFVISGYLISLISLKRIDNLKSLKQFYIKRIMRIYPALLFVSLTVMFFLSLIEYLEIETLQMFRDTMVFTSNFKAEAINLDYFGDNKNNYLLHLWSISIELQFYLIFPLLMLTKKTKDNIFPIAIGLVILSVLILSSDVSYYNSLGRMLAFSSGIVAYLISNKVQQNNSIFFISIFSLIVLSFIDMDVTTYPNRYNIVVVLFTMIALLFGKIGDEKIYKPFILIGLISYSLYLWHYPLFLFFSHCDIEHNIFNISILIITLCILASFSYTAIERGFTSKNYGNYTILSIILPLVFSIALVYYKKNQTINIPIVNSLYKKITLNPLLYRSERANLIIGNKYQRCLNSKGKLLTNCPSTKINDNTKTALVLGNSFVRSGGLVFIDKITAHYNIKSDFYYVFGDDIRTEKLYQTIIDEKYDYLIVYYPWLGATREYLLEEYKELSKYTQIILVKGANYNKAIDKKQLFRFNNLFVNDNNSAFQCIAQKPFTTDQGYEAIDSVLKELNAKSIKIYDLQRNKNGEYICSHDGIALFLDNFHINNYAGDLFAKRFIKADLGRNIFN